VDTCESPCSEDPEEECLAVLDDSACTVAAAGARPNFTATYPGGNRCYGEPLYHWWCDGQVMSLDSSNQTCSHTCPSSGKRDVRCVGPVMTSPDTNAAPDSYCSATVGRCRFTLSNPELKARLVSALETKMR